MRERKNIQNKNKDQDYLMLRIPKSLKKKLRLEAFERETDMTTIVIEALAKKLNWSEKQE